MNTRNTNRQNIHLTDAASTSQSSHDQNNIEEKFQENENISNQVTLSMHSGQQNTNPVTKIQLPTFIKERPDLWFLLVETEFKSANIRSDITKYSAVLKALDVETLTQITDVLTNPPESNAFEHLKETLVKRLSASREKQLQKLLSEIELGDKKPSQLLREMRDLAANEISDSVLQSLWLNCMPINIKPMLIFSNNIELTSLSELADKLLEATSKNHLMAIQQQQHANNLTQISPPTVAAVSNNTSPHNEINKAIISQLAELTQRIAHLETQVKKNRYRSRTRSPTPNNICYYHRRFGDKATKCTTPCSFTTQSGN